MYETNYLPTSRSHLPEDITWNTPDARNTVSCSPLTDLLLTNFALAPIEAPHEYCKRLAASGEAGKLMNFAKGTTILGFICNAGVFIATDSRASMGNFVSSRTVDKMIVITNRILGSMSGGAADCSFWQRHLSRLCRLHELRNSEQISVAAASNILANIFYNYKGYGLSAGIVMGGWDYKGPSLYFIENSGTRMKGKCFSSGSGSVYAYGILDAGMRDDLTTEEAVELSLSALYHATHRDGGSGETASVHQVTEEGYKTLVYQKDVFELHKQFCKAKGRPLDQL